MPSSITTLNADDLVSQLIDRSTRTRGRFPVPLIATTYDITLAGGLACITARRTFRNQEAQSIEAALTFPVPVHAVLYALEARIGERTVTAVAKERTAARESYEDAVDRGKTAVLHEELLKGIHMLSVAHVAPGTEIEVTARFAQPLAWIGKRALLRIPTTVGHVYGASGLPDSDDLVLGGPVTAADVKVSCGAGVTALVGGVPVGAGLRLALDRPISIEARGWTARDIRGRTAAGAPFALDIAPAPRGDASLDVALLVDRSGSMDTKCAIGAQVTKHTAVLLGLGEAAAHTFRDTDRINLWQFDDHAEDLGTANGAHVKALIRMLAPPRGGTEMGRAIDTLLAQRSVLDVVLVTDGMSHALDVQKLAALGVRFSVVLIGEDSLEANVGHLAGLTGGEIVVADGPDVASALVSVLDALRLTVHGKGEPADSACLVQARRGGMVIAARTEDGDAAIDAEAPDIARAAGAYAASLRLARLPTAEAAALAVAEGLVTHLTSLILVDEEGGAQAELPAMRKVALPTPATYVRPPALQLSRFAASCGATGGGVRQSFSYGRSKSVVTERRCVARSAASYADDDDLQAARSSPSRSSSASPAMAGETSQAPRLTQLPRRIDWRNEGQRLVEGNLIGLPNDVADAIDAAALIGVVKRAAKRLGVSARVFVIGLLARAVSGSDRHAERVYRAILARAKTRDIAHAAERLGLGA